LQALSISKSLKKTRDDVCNGEVSTEKLKHSVVESILNAGGKIDYVEVNLEHLNYMSVVS
jgi:pantothenate synthetase